MVGIEDGGTDTGHSTLGITVGDEERSDRY